MGTIIHHGTETTYDRTARKILSSFFEVKIALKRKALKRFIKKTKQTEESFSAIIFVNEHFIIFRQTVEEVYKDALGCDCENPTFIRIWRDEHALNCICAVEMFLFGGLEIDLYDENGRLKQLVMDKAVEIIKENLEVINSKDS